MSKALRIFVLLVALSLVACTSSAPPAQAPAADPPAATRGDTGWPREVTDAFGASVVIPAKPERVLTLSLGLDEIVMALAGPSRFAAISDIARSDFSNIAAQAQQVPHTVQSDLEQILGLAPDVLLLDGYAQPELVEQARAAGLTIVVTDLHETFDSHLENVEFLAYVLGEEDRGKTLVAELEHRAAALSDLVATAAAGQRAPRVLHLTPSLHIPGADTTTQDIIERAGAVNAAAEAGLASWQQVSLEKIVELAPDVIIHDEYDADRLRSDTLAHPSLQDVPAIKAGRVYEIPSRYLTTLSFWNLRAAEELAKHLWPEATGDVVFSDFD